MRISMHPDQFILLNSPRREVVGRSIEELKCHCAVLDAMGLDETAKVQIHLGGGYGDNAASMGKFVKEYRKLPAGVKRRLAVENDDRIYSLRDCMKVHREVKIPVIFDSFHHECLNNGESVRGEWKLRRKSGKMWMES